MKHVVDFILISDYLFSHVEEFLDAAAIFYGDSHFLAVSEERVLFF